jgi:hypothetical protein
MEEATTRRKEAVLNAVDRLLGAYDNWSKDVSDFKIQPDSELDDYLNVLEGVIDNGHIPQSCFELTQEVRKLLVAYRRYEEGEWKAGSLEPTERFYHCVAQVQQARLGAVPPESTTLESVKQLREQKVSDQQIARIHGTRDPESGLWSGPFFKRGVPQSKLIDSEAEHPTSVLPDGWVHPNETAKQDQFAEQMRDRLHRIDNRANEAAASQRRQTIMPSEEEILFYVLDERASPRQAYKRWRDAGLTMEAIQDILDRHDIVVIGPDGPADPIDRLSAADAALMQPPEINEDEPASTEFSQERFAERVLELSAAGQEVADIRTAVQQEFGETFSSQKVAAVLRSKSDGAAVS